MKKTLLLAAAAFAMQVGLAQAADPLKLGVLTDLSGTYSDIAGQGSVIAAQMAVDDFGGKVLDRPIEIVSADHQNKADIGSSIARKWYDSDHVEAIFDLVTSAVGLAVRDIARDRGKIDINSGAGSTALTNDKCSPTGFHWAYDTYALAVGTGGAVVKSGGTSWFFLTADYAFGQSLEKNTSDVVKASGGTVVGSVRHPFPTTDFSSFLLQAQGSGAKVIGLANAGQDTITAIKQAHEYHITDQQSLAGLLIFITDVHSLGLQTAQKLLLTTGFYWDMNDETRAFAQRFYAKAGKMPTMVHAGVYSSVTAYLKAVKAAGSVDGPTVAAKIHELPVNDVFAHGGKVRADGRMVHDMYLAQVKTPAESKAPWDYYNILRTIPGDEAYMPLSQSTCSLVKK